MNNNFNFIELNEANFDCEALHAMQRALVEFWVCANKVAAVRASLIHECFSAHQGVEDDDLNIICLGGLVVGRALAWELVRGFLVARFSGAERHCRRLAKMTALENTPPKKHVMKISPPPKSKSI